MFVQSHELDERTCPKTRKDERKREDASKHDVAEQLGIVYSIARVCVCVFSNKFSCAVLRLFMRKWKRSSVICFC